MELETNHPIEIKISLEDIIRRNPQFYTKEIDDELVCMDEKTGGCLGLNPTGRMIWEMLDKPLSIQKIIDQLTEAFPEEKEAIFNDVLSFVSYLLSLTVLSVEI